MNVQLIWEDVDHLHTVVITCSFGVFISAFSGVMLSDSRLLSYEWRGNSCVLTEKHRETERQISCPMRETKRFFAVVVRFWFFLQEFFSERDFLVSARGIEYELSRR